MKDFIECVRVASSNSQIQNERATKGFILIRHDKLPLFTLDSVNSSSASGAEQTTETNYSN